MPLLPDTTGTELALLGLAFVLSVAIGVERQVRQKSAGIRTHVLVGLGSATFTLVSAFGFQFVTGPDVAVDPSRIAAQVVSGVGFLGAGLIFLRRNVVRGLTTAATIWVVAAVGMACGAGMPLLAIAVTVLHLLTLTVLAPLARRLPAGDRKRVVTVLYEERRGALRAMLQAASDMGFTSAVLSTKVLHRSSQPDRVAVRMRFTGRATLSDLVLAISEIPGVLEVQGNDPQRSATLSASD
jgi:putative Mg2+ transporter-C (MgtC) family protein